MVTGVVGSMGPPELGRVYGSCNYDVDRSLFRWFGVVCRNKSLGLVWFCLDVSGVVRGRWG